MAASYTSNTAASGSSTLRLSACSLTKSCTDRSMTKFMFCDSWATSLCSVEKRHLASGFSPLSSTLRPVGVSPWATHSMSASRRLLPEPVGPTMQSTSPALTCSSRTGSSSPSLFRPPWMVTTAMGSSSGATKASICSMNSARRASRSASHACPRSGLARACCSRDWPTVQSGSSLMSGMPSSSKKLSTKG